MSFITIKFGGKRLQMFILSRALEKHRGKNVALTRGLIAGPRSQLNLTLQTCDELQYRSVSNSLKLV